MLTEKDYCDYDTCVALWSMGLIPHPYDNTDTDKVMAIISLYDAQKWLREEKNIIVEVFVDDDSDTPITYNIHKNGECVCHHHGRYWSIKDWNVALSEGIIDAVEILKEE